MKQRPASLYEPGLLLTCLLALLAGLFAVSGSAQAQEGRRTWSVQPASAEGPDSRAQFVYEVDPGESWTDYVSVKNLSDEELTLRVYASDAFNTESGGFDLLPAAEEPVDVGAWIVFEQESVTLGPQEAATLPFTVSVPANATPGDHPGGIVATLAQDSEDTEGNRVQVDYRVGARVYLRVGGTLAPALTVENLTIDYDSTLNPVGGGDATVIYTVTNSGNVRLIAEQEVAVSGPLGVNLKTVQIDDLPELLPGQSRNIQAVIEGVLPAGRLKASVTLEPEAADGSAVSVPAVATASSAWAVPWVQIPLLLAIGCLLAAALVWRRSVRRRAESNRFPPEVVEAVINHMNGDHAADSLLICKALGGRSEAASAVVIGVDRAGIDFLAMSGSGTTKVRLPWSHQLSDRAEVRTEVVRMYQEARKTLGLEPAGEVVDATANGHQASAERTEARQENR